MWVTDMQMLMCVTTLLGSDTITIPVVQDVYIVHGHANGMYMYNITNFLSSNAFYGCTDMQHTYTCMYMIVPTSPALPYM